MLIICRICKIEHDTRDVNNGVCYWCEQKENNESLNLQFIQHFEWERFNDDKGFANKIYMVKK